MNIGRLDKRIAIQTRRIAVDAWNHSTYSWELRANTWATVKFHSGREVQEGDQRVGIDRVSFTIRHRTDVVLTDRVEYDGEYYDIQSIEPIGRDEAIRLITTKRDNES
tara:strand:+ start:623 stop:946 length:324 start_codon:yes stop_codon:yes gene_type:complete